MAMAMNPKDAERLRLLESLAPRIQHLHGLVERFAMNHAAAEQYAPAIQRACGQLKKQLTGAGIDTIAQACAAMEMTARRGGSSAARARSLREGVGGLRLQVDTRIRTIRTEAKKAAAGGDETT
jgi:hypothetical protein